MNKRLNVWLFIMTLLIFMTSTLSVAADINFKGKGITLITTSSPGGSTDTLARMVAKFWPKYIPGNPRVIVRNSTRGNELIDFNNLYEKGRKDGTEVGASASRIIAGELVGFKIKRYELGKMELLAAFPDGYTAVYNKKVVKNGIKELVTMGDKLVAGETGPEAPSNWIVMFFKKFLNPEMKLIFGYDKYVARTAILRGETQMMHETSPLTITVWKQEPDIGVAFAAGQLDDDGNVVRDPLLPDVPTLIELYNQFKGKPLTPTELGAYKAYLGGGCGMGRGYWLPPGTPPEIVRVFRKAMADMVKDPGFVKAAGPRLEGFEPVVGEKAEKLLKNTLGQPPEALAWLKNWLATDYSLK